MRVITIFLIVIFALNTVFAQDKKEKQKKVKEDDLTTYYEQSGYKETPTYEETIEYCKKLADASGIISYQTIGKSPEGRDIPLLVLDRDGYFSAREVRQTDRIVVLIQAGIHAGEIDGKDAGLMLMRDIAVVEKNSNLLRGVTLLFIPIYNVDGHEYHFGPYSRINQNGPEKMGWRTTATNLNLNRDYLKADAPETRAWINLFVEWLPDFFIDIHATDGADYQYVLTYGMEMFGNLYPGLIDWQKNSFIKTVEKKMDKDDFPIFPYVAFRNWHDPRSGLRTWGGNPMLSHSYVAIQNRPGLLIENHMLKDYKTRVSATYRMLVHTLEVLNRDANKLAELNLEADKYTAGEDFREMPYPVEFKPSPDSIMVEFKGFEYEVVKSDLTGGNWFQYSKTPKTFNIPYFNQIIPVTKVTLPVAYIIPPQWTEIIDRIELHGVNFYRLKEPAKIKVQTYQFSDVKFSSQPFEGRQMLNSFDYEIIEEEKEFPAGSVVIDMEQGAARVVAQILEPDAPSSLLKWGFFNAIFEQKEYAESYVMETKAREMLENDPGLKAKFDIKMKNDKDFASNPRAILNWFYTNSPWWDDRINKYPVGKIMDAQILKGFIYQ